MVKLNFDVKTHILKNGLEVITIKKNTQISSINIGIKVGALNESLEEKGISHYIEHMIFKGTKNRTFQKLNDELEALGGEYNAFTDYSQTVYSISCLEEELKNAVAVENGVYTFQLRHMEKIEMTMPYGVEYIVSEEPEDYDVQITKKVSEEEEQKLDNGKKELSDILSENTDLTFTNTKEVQPATGIRQTSAPYMVMTGAAFGMLAFFGLVYGIRKWGDPTGE